MKTLRSLRPVLVPLVALAIASPLVAIGFSASGAWPRAFAAHTLWKTIIYLIVMTHVTIAAMSLCFHRMHTHQGVKLNFFVDHALQIWLWLTTSMSKRDWVAVHIYHHAHSDTELDPHSPRQKGFARIFFLGVADYAIARHNPEVIKLHRRIPENRLETFIRINSFLGPILTASTLLVPFGPLQGLSLAVLTFLISPLYAVGGVNAIAHQIGYKNYPTKDNSRNIGFVFPLNWLICGELDHNNHHAHPKSCSFRHRWYEFDIGFVYLQLLAHARLAELKFVHPVRAATITRIYESPAPVNRPSVEAG